MADGVWTEREIGRVHAEAAGPTLIVVAGIHGNEPAGVHAARRVLPDAQVHRGDLVVFAGNVAALRVGRRFQSRDLNRHWSRERLAAEPDDSEDVEQRDLAGAIDAAIGAARGEVFFVDLHTTSAAGIPFALAHDTARQRAFASAFPLPTLFGLEDNIDGTLSKYLAARGHVSLVIEGGQHDAASSIDNLGAALSLALHAAGLCHQRNEEAHAHLDRTRGDLPRAIQVVFRHGITDGDGFCMEPGFANIARALRGQLIAHDNRGEIRAPADGLVLLPLYQAQGDDGFFFGREL